MDKEQYSDKATSKKQDKQACNKSQNTIEKFFENYDISKEYPIGEVDWGSPVGKEEW